MFHQMDALKHFLEGTYTNSVSTLYTQNWDEYSARVETFISDGSYQSHWLLKPNILSPAVCARYGWKCVGKDFIQCSTCNETLCAKLPKGWESAIYNQCVQEIRRSLIEAHKDACPWPTAPSPESFIQMEVTSKKLANKSFVCRLESLLQCNKLPQVKEDVIHTEMTDDDIQSLCGLTNIPFNNDNRRAVLLAVFGWEIKSSGNVEHRNFLYCVDCHRSVALWLYTTNNSEDVNQEVLEDPAQSAKNEVFNPFHEHRHWCKWINSGLSEEKDVFGFKIYQENLLKMIKQEEPSKFSPGKYGQLNLDDVLNIEM